MKDALIVVKDRLTFDKAPPSRAIYIARILQDHGIETLLLGQKGDDPGILDFFENIVEIKPQNWGRLSEAMSKISILGKILQLLRKTRVKNAILRNPTLTFMLFPLMKIFNVRTFYDFHGYGYYEQIKKGQKIKPIFTKLFENYCLKNADVIVTQNQYNLEIAKKKNDRILLLDNGVDLTKLDVRKELSGSDRKTILAKYDIPDKRFLVGFVANITELMDVKCMLKASKKMSPDSHMIIVGSGKGLSGIDQGKYRNVTFTGRIPHDDVASLLNIFNICIYAITENICNPFPGSPRKVKEWMAKGIPIVMTDIHPKPPYFIDDENILFCRPNDPADLAEKISLLATDERKYVAMSERNLGLRDSISWDHFVHESGLIDWFLK